MSELNIKMVPLSAIDYALKLPISQMGLVP